MELKRLFLRQPIFALSVVLILALGIGLVTALVSLVNAQLYRPWQVPNPDSIGMVFARPAKQELFGSISIAEYRYLRDHSHTIGHAAAWIRNGSQSRMDDGAGHQFAIGSTFVNADYFDALEIGMAAGRGFGADDEDYGAPKAVAVISERLWRERFGREAAIIGRMIRLGQQPYQIVGVAARGFGGVERGQYRTDLWLPLPLALDGRHDLARLSDPRGESLDGLAGRLRPGVSRAAAAAELSLLSRDFRSATALPSNGIVVVDTRPTSTPGWPIPWSQLRTYALLLLAAWLVLLLTCANAGNLLLARGLSRRREIATRLSLGATRSRVVRQLLTEALALSAIAGALGFGVAVVAPSVMLRLGFALGGVDGFSQMPPGAIDRIRASFYAPDVFVFWLAMALAGITTMLAGLGPALRATRVNLSVVSAERHGWTTGGARLRFTLLAVQIALTTVFLAGAGLLTRTAGRESSLNPGFALQGLQAISIDIEYGMPGGLPLARKKTLFLDLEETLERTDIWPVAFTQFPPFSETNYVMMARRPDEAPDAFHMIPQRPVSRNYFDVMGIPLVEGRAPDSDTNRQEVVISEAAARLLWPNADPIGKKLLSALSRTEFETCEVVGVAKDVPVRSMSRIDPVIYRAPEFASTLLVRSASPQMIDRLRAIVAALEPRVAVSSRPYASYMRDALADAVLAGRVAWVLGGLCLLMATIGAFGVFAYAVEHRRREIGIRVALGARGAQIVALVFVMAGRALFCGLAAGFVMTVAAAPILRHLLYGLSPVDPIAYLEVAAVLAAAVGLATWIPTRRAIAIDPATMLRDE